jgi:DNA-binding LacI/PurR family transcriptional regulator
MGEELNELSTGEESADTSGPRPVTISFIAESAGVSIPTVSKVLNGRSGVAPETRAKVEALINEYGYRKSSATSRNNTLELVFEQLEHQWGVEIIRGVQQVARKHHVGVMLSEFGPKESSNRYWLNDAIDRRPACVVTVATLSQQQRDQLRARGIPFVVFDPPSELPDDVPFVGATNWAGGRSAARHLIGLGHRRIAMIGGPREALYCCARMDGYRSAMEAAGFPIDPSWTPRTALTQEHGYAAARQLLDHPDPAARPSAIFASNDLQALGVYQAARELGLGIPTDLSLVGFDDLPIASLLHPPLTTVHQPLAEMAAAATELALTLGRGETPPQLGLELAATLTVRESTAPPADL